MLSISNSQANALTHFYGRHILRLAQTPGMDHLTHGAPDGPETYFVSRRQPQMRPEDFEARLGDETEAVETLERAWATTPLRGLGRELIRLVRYFPPVEQEATVSSFIYEMF
jgi:hypothetical protein